MHPSNSGAPAQRESFLRLPAVEQQTGLKKSAIYAGAKVGRFPQPVRLSRRCVVWRDSEIQQWIAERVAASQAPNATNSGATLK